MTTTPKKRPSILGWILSRGLLILFSLLMTALMLEVFLRVGYDLLPLGTQGTLQHVRRVPWSETEMVPPFPYIQSAEHQARLAPDHTDYPVRWGDANFTFSTISLWDMPVGFRTAPPQFPVDIVMLGDSFTFCWTALDDCWAQKLADDYGYSVMNLGIPGTGSQSHLSIIEPYVLPLEPQVVVWQWYGNDFKDDYDFARLQGAIDALDAPAEPAPPADFPALADYSALVRLWVDWGNRQENPDTEREGFEKIVNGQSIFFSTNPGFFNLSYPAVEAGYQRSVDAFAESERVLREQLGAELVFVVIPTKEEAYAEDIRADMGDENLAIYSQGRLRMLRLCEENGWRCIDMLPAFQAAIAQGQRIYYRYDFHLDASGNALVAEAVAQYLAENRLINEEP